MVLVEKLIFLSLVTAMQGPSINDVTNLPWYFFIPLKSLSPFLWIHIFSQIHCTLSGKNWKQQITLVCLYFWDNFLWLYFGGGFWQFFGHFLEHFFFQNYSNLASFGLEYLWSCFCHTSPIKYQHVNQAIAKAYTWNKQKCITNFRPYTSPPAPGPHPINLWSFMDGHQYRDYNTGSLKVDCTCSTFQVTWTFLRILMWQFSCIEK